MRIQLRSKWAIALSGAGLALASLVGCQGSSRSTVADNPTPAQPYAGLQERDIRALEPERVVDLLAGRGAGYALAAELNHYPGPTHVLELGTQLELSMEQQNAISSIKTAMQQKAIRLGVQLVDLEEELDRAFRSGAITPEDLELLTSTIADVEGRLRNVHLQAHIQTVEMLAEAQVGRYDEVRGYVSSEETGEPTTDEHEVHGLQH